MKALKTLLMFSLVVLIGVSGAVAQDQTGQIFGNVTTEDGAVIVGAKITLTSSSLIRPLTARSNERGSYVFPSIPIGTYTVTIEAEQYQGVKMDAVTVMAGAKMRVNATLKSGVVGEEIVTITGDAPLIDVKSNQTGMAISKELFKALPKGRNFTTMVALAPGAVDDGIGGGIMIDGASASENVWVIDGVDVTSFYTGKPTSSAVFEFIEEIQVRSGGYEAEFGGSMGGVVNVVTRSGGNEFHGEGTLYYNSDAFDADDRKELRISPLDDETPEYVTWPKDEYTRLEFGGALGGYALKDRVWFFASYMPVFVDRTRTVDFRGGNEEVVATQAYDQEEKQHRASVKLTAQVTDQMRVSASYLTDWYKWTGSLPSKAGHSPMSIDPDYDQKGAKEPGWDAAGSIDYSLTDWLFANVKGGWHYQDYNQLGATDAVRRVMNGNISQFASDPAYAQVPAQYRVPSGFSSRPHEYATDHNIQKKYNVSGDLTFFTEAAGSHTIKGGVQFFHIYQDVSEAYSADYVIFYWGRTFSNQFTGVSGRGKYGYYRVVTAHPGGYGTVAETESDRWGLFLQDSWSVSDKLTFNLGIRTEKEDIPSFSDLPEYSDPPITFDFDQKLAPRLGFAYDFYGDGTLKIFGNWARYFDVMKLAMAEGSYGGFKWRDRYFGLDTLEWWTIGTTGFGTWPRDMSKYPGSFYGGEIDWRIPSFETTDPDLEPTSIDEYILGGDYALTDNLGLNVRFVHKRLRYLIEDVGIYTDEGEEYFITNPGYGYSVSKLSGGFPATQKAKRHYWGLEARLNKRFSDNWAGGANITLSRLTGNVSGLASTDEFGRDDPNVNRYFDNWVMSYDASWNPIDGVLPTDRRYKVDIFGSYTFDFGLIAGITQTIQDGTPISTMVDLNGLDGYMPYNRGDQGRMDMYTQTDLYLEYNFKFDQYTAQLSMNISNLFDQDTAWRKQVEKDRDNPTFTEDELLAYYQSRTTIPESAMFLPGGTSRYSPTFLMDNAFQGPRSIRLGVKFLF